jgi:hypothetical protein
MATINMSEKEEKALEWMAQLFKFGPKGLRLEITTEFQTVLFDFAAKLESKKYPLEPLIENVASSLLTGIEHFLPPLEFEEVNIDQAEEESDHFKIKLLPEKLSQKIFAKLKTTHCRCGEQLPIEVYHYQHSEGWKVSGFSEKQWLYIQCPHCTYQNAISKLGVPRNYCF